MYTVLGHILQKQQELRSTKVHSPTFNLNSATNELICTLLQSHNEAYMNFTSRFPYNSTRGNEYILIVHHIYSDAIIGLPIINRQAATIKNAWE